MKWQVYREDFNSREIKVYDIFQHHSFLEDVKKLCKKRISKEKFAEQLRIELMYYFWCKCEHEVVITSWPPYIDKEELDRLNTQYEKWYEDYGRYPFRLDVRLVTGDKIDIYDQVMMNWDVFVDYVWRNRKEI